MKNNEMTLWERFMKFLSVYAWWNIRANLDLQATVPITAEEKQIHKKMLLSRSLTFSTRK